jgi:CyaY protein
MRSCVATAFCSNALMDDKDYRKQVLDAQQRILKAFDDIDPDVVEAELSQGALTILAKGKKIIVSPQPPVKQVWLAAANLGIAVHFDWHPDSQKWIDDKGKGLELYAFTSEVVQKACGLSLTF